MAINTHPIEGIEILLFHLLSAEVKW
eukprot:UN14891